MLCAILGNALSSCCALLELGFPERSRRVQAGRKKLHATINMNYYWTNMAKDINDFCKGCVLCSIFKTSNTGKTEIGTPRKVTQPFECIQMDICSGFPKVNGFSSFLNIVDLYTGYVIPVALKNENSATIAKILEENVFKVFGIPKEISSDNAANLQGPEIKKLFHFYNILHRQTVPYSPQSHALVEIQNRYVTQLVRILTDQFQTNWINVLTLATLITNSVPRPELLNHSPYFLLFNQEPFENKEISNEELNLSAHLQKSENNKNFIRLLREFLLFQREKKNKAIKRTYLSFPVGTLILIKDNRPRVHKKSKPIYFKCPQKVVNEYHSTVYSEDFLGRVFKHSKNNVKIANERTKELFGILPENIKMILGEEINSQEFDEIKNEGILPEYLKDLEIMENMERITRSRGQLPEDNHLLEQSQEVENNIEFEDDFEEIENSRFMKNLKNLHNEGKLKTKTTMKEVATESYIIDHERLLEEDDNYLDTGLERQDKRVTFNLPN